MKILATQEDPAKHSADLILLFAFEERRVEQQLRSLDQALEGQLTKLVEHQDLTGKQGTALLLPTHGRVAAGRLLLIGLGKRSEFSRNTLREAIGASARFTKHSKISAIGILPPSTLPKQTTISDLGGILVETLLTARYSFEKFKKKEEGEPNSIPLTTITFLTKRASDRSRIVGGAISGERTAGGINLARDLGNHPGNHMTPDILAATAKLLAKTNRFSCKVMEKAEIKKLGMGALLGINQGSALPPKFIILEYKGKKTTAPTVLVGKGITFDSGGLSIKPSKSMEEMKFDMAGAATVLGIFKVASELKLPQHLIGLIPATENLPSGTAIKPGDVVTALSGKTIEIINTDAEGRMVLADALAYAAQYKPKLVIDFATLTGAMVVALGNDLTGGFSNARGKLDQLIAAGEKSGEPIWPMPMPESYKPHIKSHVADIKNTGADPWGGAIAGAMFLQEFVSYPWIHLDIAGTAWTTSDQPGKPKGATGVGVRLILEYLK